jgi:hypothetical protein
MDRRDFMKAAAMTGLALASPLAVPKKARAADDPYTGLFVITVHAGGGWDPTSLCDPKGFNGNTVPDAANTVEMNKSYGKDEIRQAGNIKYAPLFDAGVAATVRVGNRNTNIPEGVNRTAIGTAANFFEKHYQHLTVVNGIDVQTNDHDGGTRNTWSGFLAEGRPTFAAMFASAVAREKPLAFMTAGGYDFTAGTVSATRTGQTGQLLNIALPNVRNPNSVTPEYFHTPDTYARIERFQRERTQAAAEAQHLPRWRNALNTLFTVRDGNNELKRVVEVLGSNVGGKTLQASLNDLGNNDFARQVRLGIGAYKAGIAASLNLGTPGPFDTHSMHDQSQIPSLRRLLANVDFIWEELAIQGVDPAKVMIIVGSDFGRTPGYNDGNGKDHWSTTSMMFMGGPVPGNRVVGASDERHRMLALNPSTLAPDTNGVRITPGIINLALRDKTGIRDSEVAREFPSTVLDEMKIFG